jgi:hypothetical protein
MNRREFVAGLGGAAAIGHWSDKGSGFLSRSHISRGTPCGHACSSSDATGIAH